MSKSRYIYQNRVVKHIAIIIIMVLSVIVLLRLLFQSLKSNISFAKRFMSKEASRLMRNFVPPGKSKPNLSRCLIFLTTVMRCDNIKVVAPGFA